MAVWDVQGAGVTLPSLNAGADGPAALSRRGEQLTVPWYQEWVNKGRVYQASNPTVGTAVALSGTGYVATTPALLLTVPAGTGARVSACSFYSGATAAGVTTHIQLYGAIITHDVATTPNAFQNVVPDWPLPGEPAPLLVGPASLLVHSFAATTAPSWHYAVRWIELDS